MDRNRLAQILEAYGADQQRWPEAERDAAREALAVHADALAAELQAAREADALLALDRDDRAPSDLLAARIVKRAPAPAFSWTSPARVAALAACAALGLVLGLGGARLAPDPEAADLMLSAAFGAPLADPDSQGGDG